MRFGGADKITLAFQVHFPLSGRPGGLRLEPIDSALSCTMSGDGVGPLT